MTRGILSLVMFFLVGLLPAHGSTALSATEIVRKATAASGGDAWLFARTNVMTGSATIFRGQRAMHADRYEMRRVYPTSLNDAHTNTGKFRLDSYVGDRLMFTISFDGQQMYDRSGPMPEAQARELAASSFGFSAVRFALTEGFELLRVADDQVEGHPCYFIQITDPIGGNTLVAIDTESHLFRYVGWQTPRGWHHRVYSDYYALESGFMQPGHVRLYYDGIKSADIKWTNATLNAELPGDLFVVHPDP
jgi:hypothetical protein